MKKLFILLFTIFAMSQIAAHCPQCEHYKSKYGAWGATGIRR